MYILKQGLSKKERRQVEYILSEVIDLYGDFYATKNNIRISLRDNVDELFKYIQKGSKIVYNPESEKGLALVLKEKGFRTYIKILTKDEHEASNLLKIINWNTKEDLYIKIHKNNPIAKICQRQSYKFMGDRGSEILLCRKYIPRLEKKYDKDIKGE